MTSAVLVRGPSFDTIAPRHVENGNLSRSNPVSHRWRGWSDRPGRLQRRCSRFLWDLGVRLPLDSDLKILHVLPRLATGIHRAGSAVLEASGMIRVSMRHKNGLQTKCAGQSPLFSRCVGVLNSLGCVVRSCRRSRSQRLAVPIPRVWQK
jgi:hypothetical protein